MCGRFALAIPIEVIAELLRMGAFPLIEPRFNIAPTQGVLAARVDEVSGERAFASLTWGLVPAWANDASVGAKMINARSETIFSKPAFRDSILTRRCVIPASGFYEWEAIEGQRAKQPHFVKRADGEAMLFAGLWDRWIGPNGPLDTCSVITVAACSSLERMHHRMPAILEASDVDAWLDPTVRSSEALSPLMRTASDTTVASHPVRPLVNRVANDEPRCMEVYEPPAPEPGLFG